MNRLESPGFSRGEDVTVTGESRTLRRGVGDNVVAGTVATDSGLRVEITAIDARTDVAIASAGVILASSDPPLGAFGNRIVEGVLPQDAANLWWAAGYNLISVPLAAGVLAPIGFVLPMSVGAVPMSLSTVIVSLNAQLLRRLDLRPEVSA